jgi:hypothetical protein
VAKNCSGILYRVKSGAVKACYFRNFKIGFWFPCKIYFGSSNLIFGGQIPSYNEPAKFGKLLIINQNPPSWLLLDFYRKQSKLN